MSTSRPCCRSRATDSAMPYSRLSASRPSSRITTLVPTLMTIRRARATRSRDSLVAEDVERSFIVCPESLSRSRCPAKRRVLRDIPSRVAQLQHQCRTDQQHDPAAQLCVFPQSSKPSDSDIVSVLPRVLRPKNRVSEIGCYNQATRNLRACSPALSGEVAEWLKAAVC